MQTFFFYSINLAKLFCLISFVLLLCCRTSFGQTPSDTSQSPKPGKVVVKPDTITRDKSSKDPGIDSSGIKDMGVAVSPSSMRFRIKPGKTETKYVTITNDTYKREKFKLSFSDVGMDNFGKISQVPVGQNAKEYGLVKWISASPNFVELGPGEQKKIAIVLNIPDEEAAYKAGWCLLMVDQAREKNFIAPKADDNKAISMGVIPTYGFGVYIYQNPPNVAISKVEIVSFTFNYDAENRYVHLNARNIGDGIANCKSYIEVNNLNTGYKERLPLKQFNVLPKQERLFEFILPGKIPKGKYSVTGVLDFGSEEELEAAELEITVN